MKILFGCTVIAVLQAVIGAADTAAAAEVTINAAGATTSATTVSDTASPTANAGDKNNNNKNDTTTSATTKDSEAASTSTTTESSSSTATTEENKEKESTTGRPNTILHEYVPTSDCGLYLADSMLPRNASSPGGPRLGLFAGKDYNEGDMVGEPDLIIPLLDKFKTLPYRGQHRTLSWLEHFVKGTTNYNIPKNRPLAQMRDSDFTKSATGIQYTDDLYRIDAFAPGIAALAAQHPGLANVALASDLPSKDSEGLHRSKDPGVGAFTPHAGLHFVATDYIYAGQELYSMPSQETIRSNTYAKPYTTITPRWLERHGMCVDNLKVTKSKLRPQAGRGAFAKRAMAKDSVIVPTPLAVLKRDDLTMYASNPEAMVFSDVLNKDEVIGTELLLNYAFGHADSDILLVPLAPMVNFINHDAVQPNAMIRWPNNNNGGKPSWLETHPLDLLDMSGQIMMEIVALRDIEPDEEIVIDYGDDWDEKWMGHVEAWGRGFKKEKNYMSAIDYMQKYDFDVRTVEEQKKKPYPPNMMTVCYFRNKVQMQEKIGPGCWLPCDVKSREGKDEESGEVVYKASYVESKHGKFAENMIDADACVPSSGKRNSKGMVAKSIALLDIWDTTDQHLDRAFRKEIRVPDGFYPDLWIKEKATYELTPLPEDFKPGQFVPITFKHTGKPVTRNAYFVGLPKNFTENMRQYAEDVGAMAHFRDVLGGRYNKPGEERFEELNEGEWYIQRPRWNSNMHWVIPWNEVARKSYLRALGKNGFDDVLESMGTGMGLEKLTCFHNTFLGLSQADDSNMHADFYETQRSSFDFLAPIIMANTTKPELDLQSQDGNVIVGVKYQYGVAVVMGDWTYHKSAAADYTAQNEIRVVSSIYCSDITEENRKSIMKMYKEEAPAPFKHLFDMPIKEKHWAHDGTKLPKPPKASETTSTGTNFNLIWPEGS